MGKPTDEQRKFLDAVSARPPSKDPNQLPNHTYWRFYILSTRDSKYDFDIKPSMSHRVPMTATDAQIRRSLFRFMTENYQFRRVLIDRNKVPNVTTIHRLRKYVYVNGHMKECRQRRFADVYAGIRGMFSHC